MTSAEEIINHFNNKVKLSEFLNQFLELKNRGNSFIARCPFHNEKTPSFTVSDEKGLYYCFGCGEGGNVFNFVSKYKNLTPKESLKFICDYMGISMVDKISSKHDLKKKKFALINSTVNEFFKSCLTKNKIVLRYLNDRKIKESAIRKFSLGFCSSKVDSLKIYCEKHNIFEDDLLEVGIFIKSSKDQSLFNRFGNRITFPIYNKYDEVIGFGGRTTNNSKIKYINSQENELFKKGENIYGLKQNLNDIKVQNQIILVEGYLDVISLNSNGIKTSVAALGTAVSENQILKLWNYNDSPIICFDGDAAGKNAMKNLANRILKILRPGKSIKFANLPDNTDPDDYVKSFGKKSFFNMLESSVALSEFIWEQIKNKHDVFTPENLALIDNDIKIISNKIEDRNVANEYFKFLRKTKADTFWNFDNSKINKKNNLKKIKDIKDINEVILISILIYNSNIVLEFLEDISLLKFTNPLLENIKEVILEKIINRNDENDLNLTALFLEKFSEHKLLFEKIRSDHFKELNAKEKNLLFKNILQNLQLPDLIKEREILKKEMIANKNNFNMEFLLKKYHEINKEINTIKNREI